MTFLLFAAFEVYLRVASSRKGARDETVIELGFLFNEKYLVSLKPGVEKDYARSELNGLGKITWRANSEGFRGEEIEGNADFRVMVYGDSNIQARFVELKDTFPARLKRELEALYGLDVEVINAAVVGFGPDQSLLKLKDEYERYAPDLVVFSFFADNDYGDLIRNRLFEVDSEGVLVRSPHPVTPDARLEKRERPGFFKSLRIVNWASGLKSKALLKEAMKDGSTGFAGLLEKEYAVYDLRLPRQFSTFDDHYDFDLAFFPDRPGSVEKARLAEAVLGEVSRFSKAKGFELLLMLQPSSRDLTENSYPNHTHFAKYKKYEERGLVSIAERIVARLGVESVSLFDTFKENDPSKLFFLGVNDHWNEAGQALAAHEVGEYINDRGLLRK